MTLNEYQEKAMTTCMESSNNFSYMMLNLVGEVGELASKVAKAIRKEKAQIDNDLFCIRGAAFTKEQLLKMNKEELKAFATDISCDAIIEMQQMDVDLMFEAGDILWQLAGLCSVMGWDLEDIAQMNLGKLSARKKAGTIDGNGDGITDRK